MSSRVFAVVPAAGLSQRMGQPKLGLKLGRRTVLQRVVDALKAGGVDGVLVVLGPASNRHAKDVSDRASVEILSRQTPQMRETVSAGLAAIQRRFQPDSKDAFLLALGDHPTVRPEVVEQLLRHRTPGEAEIVVPVFGGRRGHPVLFSWTLREEVDELPPDRGINHLLNRPELVKEVEATSSEILDDLDTPADFETMRARDWDGELDD